MRSHLRTLALGLVERSFGLIPRWTYIFGRGSLLVGIGGTTGELNLAGAKGSGSPAAAVDCEATLGIASVERYDRLIVLPGI